MIKRLAFTPGEPAGIGIDLAILSAQKNHLANTKNSLPTPYQLVAFADAETIKQRAKKLGIAINLKEVDLNDEPTVLNNNELGFVQIDTQANVEAGVLDSRNAQYVLNTLDSAIEACKNNDCHAMVTGPVQKSIINDAGIHFSGHTEYLADKTHTEQVVMMLATEGLRVALATTHLPLANVPSAINQASLLKTLHIINHDLKYKFGIEQPNILVCGLNPHAGEGGHLGREEIEIITPALEIARQQYIHCQGPLPADTLFTPKYLENADAVLAMYHDQGLPVLKYKGFGAAANITLGLPIIRTSVDHGTALDLAGTGNIDTGSLNTAIHYALEMNIDDNKKEAP